MDHRSESVQIIRSDAATSSAADQLSHPHLFELPYSERKTLAMPADAFLLFPERGSYCFQSQFRLKSELKPQAAVLIEYGRKLPAFAGICMQTLSQP